MTVYIVAADVICCLLNDYILTGAQLTTLQGPSNPASKMPVFTGTGCECEIDTRVETQQLGRLPFKGCHDKLKILGQACSPCQLLIERYWDILPDIFNMADPLANGSFSDKNISFCDPNFCCCSCR